MQVIRHLNSTQTARVLGLALLLSAGWCLRLEAESSGCQGPGALTGESATAYDSAHWEVRLPLGQDERSCQSRATVNFDTGDTAEISYSIIDPIKLVFLTEGIGPFEAEVTIDFSPEPESIPLGIGGRPVGVVTSASVESGGDGVEPGLMTPALLPVSLDTDRNRWSESKIFTGTTLEIRARFEDLLLAFLEETRGVSDPFVDAYDLTLEVRMTLRRVKGCYMWAKVTEGSEAGIYSGDVAVLGSPTGVSDGTLEMWFGSPQDADAVDALQTFQDVVNSDAGEQAMQGMSAKAMEQLQAVYKGMSQAAGPADPIQEVREMLVLTLEDVKFDGSEPGSTLQALTGMAGHFVLAAQLAGGEPVGKRGGYHVLLVESVGVKGPGLGLANTKSSCGKSGAPLLLVVGCDPNDPQANFDLNRISAVCGGLWAEVFNEQCQKLKVEARFLAGRSIEQCIR